MPHAGSPFHHLQHTGWSAGRRRWLPSGHAPIRPSTLKVLRATDKGLIEEAKRVLTQWRYLPAEVDGRKVAQLVQTAIER